MTSIWTDVLNYILLLRIFFSDSFFFLLGPLFFSYPFYNPHSLLILSFSHPLFFLILSFLLTEDYVYHSFASHGLHLLKLQIWTSENTSLRNAKYRLALAVLKSSAKHSNMSATWLLWHLVLVKNDKQACLHFAKWRHKIFYRHFVYSKDNNFNNKIRCCFVSCYILYLPLRRINNFIHFVWRY